MSPMSKLIYINNTSLDGYVEDETGAVDGNLSVWAPTLRDDVLLGCAGGGLSTGTPQLRRGLAGGREDRLFTNADKRYDAQHAYRAGLRRRAYSEAQAGIGARHQHWRR